MGRGRRTRTAHSQSDQGPWYGSGRTYVAATRRWRKGSKEACCGATFAVRNFKEQTHDPGAPLARRRACAETRDGAVVARQVHDLEVGVFDSPFRNQFDGAAVGQGIRPRRLRADRRQRKQGKERIMSKTDAIQSPAVPLLMGRAGYWTIEAGTLPARAEDDFDNRTAAR